MKLSSNPGNSDPAPTPVASESDPFSTQKLGGNASGDIRPLQGRVMSASRSTDTWRQEVMTMLRALGVTDNTSA